MAPATYQYRGVSVSWDPGARVLRMRHGPDPALDDHTAWTLGTQVGTWIRGLEGQVAAIVDASGVDHLPEDWLAYWVKVLRRGFLKGVVVHSASRPFARAARDVGRATGVPVLLAADDAEALALLQALPPALAPA